MDYGPWMEMELQKGRKAFEEEDDADDFESSRCGSSAAAYHEEEKNHIFRQRRPLIIVCGKETGGGGGRSSMEKSFPDGSQYIHMSLENAGKSDEQWHPSHAGKRPNAPG